MVRGRNGILIFYFNIRYNEARTKRKKKKRKKTLNRALNLSSFLEVSNFFCYILYLNIGYAFWRNIWNLCVLKPIDKDRREKQMLYLQFNILTILIFYSCFPLKSKPNHSLSKFSKSSEVVFRRMLAMWWHSTWVVKIKEMKVKNGKIKKGKREEKGREGY